MYQEILLVYEKPLIQFDNAIRKFTYIRIEYFGTPCSLHPSYFILRPCLRRGAGVVELAALEML